MRERKYIKAERLTLSRAINEIMAGRYIFWHDKPTHPGWAMSWQVMMLSGACTRGIIYRAKINPKWKKAQ